MRHNDHRVTRSPSDPSVPKVGLGEAIRYDPLEAFYDRHHLVPISATDKVDGQDITVIVEADARLALEAADQRIEDLTQELIHQVRETARLVNVAAGTDVRQWREDQTRLIQAHNDMYESRQTERGTVRRQDARVKEFEAVQAGAGMPAPAELALQEIALFAQRHEFGATRWAEPHPVPEWVVELLGLLGDFAVQPGNAVDGSYDGSEGEQYELHRAKGN